MNKNEIWRNEFVNADFKAIAWFNLIEWDGLFFAIYNDSRSKWKERFLISFKRERVISLLLKKVA